MTESWPEAGGIIAAGAGTRLRAAGGGASPKPLVKVGGMALLERVIRNFQAAGIGPLTAIVSEAAVECVDWVRSRFPALDVRFIVKTTASSLESFLEVVGVEGAGPMLVSTVDAWCRPEDFVAFVEAAHRCPRDAMVLAVTPFVADERPLRVQLGGDGHVVEIGGDTGDMVTAGMYLVPERVRRLNPPAGLGRLRDFLVWLHHRGEPVHAVIIPVVVDVDRSEDIDHAERLAGAAPGVR
jgi:NDP-sugar pyrophosphorylase family protein